METSNLISSPKVPSVDAIIEAAAGAVKTVVSSVYVRDGVELEKGAIITAERIKKNRELYEKYNNFFSAYPDLYLDLIKRKDMTFDLFFYQRIFLRLAMRYARLLIIACRAFSKSFLSILALYLLCIFKPRSKLFIVAPGKAQSAKIANEKIHEIWDLFPLLKKEIVGEGNFGGDEVKLTFRNKSIFDVVSALNSQRGGRRNGGLIDEFRDHDVNDLNDIVLPLMNVSRKMQNGQLNPYENQQIQFWMSSASDKNTFCYDKTIEMLELAIINPKKAFIFGCDYRVPMMHNLLPKDYINEIKASPTFSETSFSREYLSRFVGSSTESWFDFDKLMSNRILMNPETREKVRVDGNEFYILSVDIARIGCQTVCTVLKVFPNDGGWKVNLVNLYVLGKTAKDKEFSKQVIELKKLMALYNPREVVIDINGIGQPFGDDMVKESIDTETGLTLPAYGFSNYDNIFTQQPKNCPRILYGIKANAQLNSDMHSVLYSKIYSGQLRFLIPANKASIKIMATRKGQRMSPEDRNKRLLPHELTTILISEIMNLKQKPTGVSNQIAVEMINKRMTKDKFSALEMGVYRISQLENDYLTRRQNRGLGRKLTFYTKGR